MNEPRTLFDRYTVLEELGGGGMSQGFRVCDAGGAELFLKRVPVSGISADALRRELDIYARVQRSQATHVLEVLGHERDDDFVALVTEFADGGNLEDYAKDTSDGFSPPEAKPILLEILAGLRELHDLDIVHRDLKPANIFLVQGKWKLGDFGISKSLARLQTQGRTFQMHGTHGYAPPEQLEGAEAHPSADIYSFGKLLAFLLTGQTDVDQIAWPTWGQIARACTTRDPAQRPGLDEVEKKIAALAVESPDGATAARDAPRPRRGDGTRLARPVSAILERELRTLLATKPLVWLDRDDHYGAFVDQLKRDHEEGKFPVPVVAFRGSFLEAMLELEKLTESIEPAPFLLHLPGFNEKTIRPTSLLETYEAFADRYRKALDTLIVEAAAGLVAPEEVREWIAAGKRTLADADRWVAESVGTDRHELAERLSQMGLDAVFSQLVAALEGRRDEALLGRHVRTVEEGHVLSRYLERHVGVSAAWRDAYAVGDDTMSEFGRVGRTLVSWLLAVEYVHDLAREPFLPTLRALRELPKPYVATASKLLGRLRSVHGDTYAALADDVEQDLEAEIAQMRAEDLGKIDTFRSEDVRVLEGAVDLLLTGRWDEARSWCEPRQGTGKSFWLDRDKRRAWAWSLVAEAAKFGQVLEATPRPLERARSLQDAVEQYTKQAATVDRAHREFEQKRVTVLDSRLPHFAALQRVVGGLRQRYRVWADQLAEAFTKLCEEHGFLPPSQLRQRNIFDEVVLPLLADGAKVAVLAIDALRYEMGAALAADLGGTGIEVQVDARLAELPTLTSVGMNVLAPVAQAGRLRPAGDFKGFRSSEFIVNTPDTRARAMGLRATGATAVRLELPDVVADSVEKLRQRVAQASLLLVCGREIDDAGETGVGPATFDSSLRQVVSAVHQLHAAGVASVIITADHGFLLQDETTDVRRYGNRRDPERRHVLAQEGRREDGMVPVKLSDLEYEGMDGYLLFRKDTAVFATARSGANFVHGGNSLQERVIPVVTVRQLRAGGQLHNELVIETERLGRVLGCERLRIRVEVARETPLALGFMGATPIQLGLRARDRQDASPVVRDIQGPGRLRPGGIVEMSVGDAWLEAFISITGPRDERVQLEVFSVGGHRARVALVDGWFEVEGREAAQVSVHQSGPAADWSNVIPNEGARRVFLHLHRHGSLKEAELVGMLGSARAARRFALEFDNYLTMLPFRVRVEPGPEGKRYVREDPV